SSAAITPDAAETLRALAFPKPLAPLRMTSGVPAFLRTLVEVARVDLRELRSSPGLYLFVPLILVQTLGTSLLALGAFDPPVLITPGTDAGRSMNTLTLLVCLLLLFYQTESLLRERTSRLGSILFASPVRSLAILAGKTLGNAVMASAVLLGGLI